MDKPDIVVGEMSNQFAITISTQVTCPDDLRAIDVSPVVDPLEMPDVSRRIMHDDEVLTFLGSEVSTNALSIKMPTVDGGVGIRNPLGHKGKGEHGCCGRR